MFGKNKDKKSDPLGRVFTPRLSGFTGQTKPKVLILKSSFDKDENGGAVSYKAAKSLAEDRGCTVLNRDEIVYDIATGELHTRKNGVLKSKSEIIAGPFQANKQPIIVWFETHGCPGWLFGGRADFKTEDEAARRFSKCMHQLQETTGFSIDTVLLHSCFSATEIINPETGAFANSSARLLSVLLPNQDVIGFLGKNSGAKVTNTYELVHGDYQPRILTLAEGCVLFRGGVAIKFSGKEYFTNIEHGYFKRFTLGSCDIQMNSGEFFRISPAKEHVDRLRAQGVFASTSYGDRQLVEYKEMKEQVAKEEEKPEPK